MARMGASHLAPQGGGYEPQRKFDFEVELYGVPGQEVIKLSLKQFSPPGANNEAIELGYLNEVIKVAGQGKWDDVSMICRDFVDQPTFSSIMQWKKMVQDPSNGNIGLASSYKKQGHIKLIGPDGSGERKYKLIGVWPKTVKGEQLDMTANAEYTIEVTLSCDKAIPEF